MIKPNFEFLLWAILILNSLLGVTYIIAGILGVKKPNRTQYGILEITSGIIYLIIATIVFLT